MAASRSGRCRSRAAVTKFRALLGEQNVLVKAEPLISYHKIMMSMENAAHAPAAALTATTVEQVQGIVKICNQHRIPVWTISTGRNFGYGTAAPVQHGQVILDLKKMNRIIEIDPDMCTARVEPGVTFQQLYDYIEENKPQGYSSCASRRRNTRSRGDSKSNQREARPRYSVRSYLILLARKGMVWRGALNRLEA